MNAKAENKKEEEIESHENERELVKKHLENGYVDDIDNWITFEDPDIPEVLNKKIKKKAKELKENGKKWIDNDPDYIEKINKGDLEYLVGYSDNEAIETYKERVDEGIEEE